MSEVPSQVVWDHHIRQVLKVGVPRTAVPALEAADSVVREASAAVQTPEEALTGVPVVFAPLVLAVEVPLVELQNRVHVSSHVWAFVGLLAGLPNPDHGNSPSWVLSALWGEPQTPGRGTRQAVQ